MSEQHSRVGQLASWFGMDALRRREPARLIPADVLDRATPAPGAIVLLTGPSGAGKSSLLRRVVERARRDGRAVIDVARRTLPGRPVIDCFPNIALEEAISLLSRLGLAEARLLARHPRNASAGQKLRLRLALALARCCNEPVGSLLVCDEFAALLDRVSAVVIAGALRRTIDALPQPPGVLLATSHDDLRDALDPETVIDCDFGEWRVLSRATSGARRSGTARPAHPPATSRVVSHIRRGASSGSAPASSAPPRGGARDTACRSEARRTRSAPPASACVRTRRRRRVRLPAPPRQAARRGRTPGTCTPGCRGCDDVPSGSSRRPGTACSARPASRRPRRLPSRVVPARDGSSGTARVRPNRSRRSVLRNPGK